MLAMRPVMVSVAPVLHRANACRSGLNYATYDRTREVVHERGNMNNPTGDNASYMHELKLDLEAELALAETSESVQETLGKPIGQWLFNPTDVERELVGLRNLLGAVEVIEDGLARAMDRTADELEQASPHGTRAGSTSSRRPSTAAAATGSARSAAGSWRRS
jgi:hypothetical protein